MSNINDELKSVLLDLLRVGLLRIRAYGSDGDAEKCAIEADHLHNLPGLARNPRVELLSYYWNVERAEFIKRAGDLEQFEKYWKRLRELLESSKSSKSS